MINVIIIVVIIIIIFLSQEWKVLLRKPLPVYFCPFNYQNKHYFRTLQGNVQIIDKKL